MKEATAARASGQEVEARAKRHQEQRHSSLVRAAEEHAGEGGRALLEAYRDAHGGDCNVPCRSKDDPRQGGRATRRGGEWRTEDAGPATTRLSAERDCQQLCFRELVVDALLEAYGVMQPWAFCGYIRQG